MMLRCSEKALAEALRRPLIKDLAMLLPAEPAVAGTAHPGVYVNPACPIAASSIALSVFRSGGFGTTGRSAKGAGKLSAA